MLKIVIALTPFQFTYNISILAIYHHSSDSDKKSDASC